MHVSGWFDGQPSGIKSNSLAYQAHAFQRGSSRHLWFVFHYDEVGRKLTAAINGQQSMQAQGFSFGLIEGLHRIPPFLAGCQCPLGQVFRQLFYLLGRI